MDQHDLFLDVMSTRVGDEVLVTFTDYTPLKMAKRQLEKYVEELKRSNNNLQDFAYAASHDLKEPIRKIKIFSERLKIDLLSQLTPVQKNYFERMEGAAMRMNALIEDLLFYNEVSVHQKEQQEIDFNHLVDQVLHDLDLEIEEKLATISVAPLFTFRGHSRHLQQVFQNLIGNALKYSHPGKKPEISITYDEVKGARLDLPLTPEELQNTYYVIEVRDNGIGFDPADAGRIFNLFQRLHNNSSYLGTGLGLSIVRKVIENHGGYIVADGMPGEGAVFKVVLPALS